MRRQLYKQPTMVLRSSRIRTSLLAGSSDTGSGKTEGDISLNFDPGKTTPSYD
jgi:hypothetical protein